MALPSPTFSSQPKAFVTALCLSGSSLSYLNVRKVIFQIVFGTSLNKGLD